MVYLPYQKGEISNLPPLSSLCLPNPYLLWVLEGHIQHRGWAGTGVGIDSSNVQPKLCRTV